MSQNLRPSSRAKSTENKIVNPYHRDKVPFKIEHYVICIKFKIKITKTKSSKKTGLWWLKTAGFDIHSKGLGSPEKLIIWRSRNFRYFAPKYIFNIPSSPAYGVYIPQLLRYARAFRNYADLLYRARTLINRLLEQSYVATKLKSSLHSSSSHLSIFVTFHSYFVCI